MPQGYQKGGASVFVQTSNLDTFDPSSCYRIGMAQSYTLNEGTSTENIIDIGDVNTLAENPTANGTNASGQLNALKVINFSSLPEGQIDVSLGSMINAGQLKNNQQVWIIFGNVDANNVHLVDGTNNTYRYAKALITGKTETQNGRSPATFDYTFTIQGDLYYSS